MNAERDPLDEGRIDELLARAEHDPEASRELDFLADLVAAAEQADLHVPARPRPRPRRLVLAAGAAALVLCTLWALLRSGDARPDARTAWRTPPPFVATELRAPAPLASELATALEPYGRADWAGARGTLAEFLARHPGHALASFYLAAVQVELGELDAARTSFAAAAASDDELLADDARLRLAVLELDTERAAEARAALERLARDDGPFAAAARELLDGP